MRPMACTLLVAAFVSGVAATPQEKEEWGEDVTIRLVGYPDVRVNEREACGQRTIHKSLLDPNFNYHLLVLGWREGNCSALGFTKYEHTINVNQQVIPYMPAWNVTFDVYSRDPTMFDVAGCIYRECRDHLDSFGSSAYLSDAVDCMGPAFSPCVDKAWDCLGDDVCRSALDCLPTLAKDCGKAVWKVLTDSKEREKVECIWRCNNSKLCIIEKCTVNALECFTGIGDPICHEAAFCVPEKLMGCSGSAFGCVFSMSSGVCRDNLKCLAHGAGQCADPVWNLGTDRNISELLYCANTKCPRPATPAEVASAIEASKHAPPAELPVATVTAPGENLPVVRSSEMFPQWPIQAACMSLHCGVKGAGLLLDKDLQAFGTCLLPGVQSCGSDLWDCLGDEECQKDVECWANGLVANADDLWKMVTDEAERQFDQELAQCVEGCGKEFDHTILRAMCVAGKCGPKSAMCMADATCRHIFTDIPWTIGKCGSGTITNKKFLRAAQCAAHIANVCGTTAIELLRDRQLADLIDCNGQCTRAPGAFVVNVTRKAEAPPRSRGAVEVIV